MNDMGLHEYKVVDDTMTFLGFELQARGWVFSLHFPLFTFLLKGRLFYGHFFFIHLRSSFLTLMKWNPMYWIICKPTSLNVIKYLGILRLVFLKVVQIKEIKMNIHEWILNNILLKENESKEDGK